MVAALWAEVDNDIRVDGVAQLFVHNFRFSSEMTRGIRLTCAGRGHWTQWASLHCLGEDVKLPSPGGLPALLPQTVVLTTTIEPPTRQQPHMHH
ncbi:hypothetical protein J6590_034674 [Homalodisca vitripennis]|nr:hypothetical protein J6590_034674 [Homalodisca vitripennis]